MNIRVRAWSKLAYLDPKGVLIALRNLAESGLLDGAPYHIGSLRTNDLRPVREGRQCALFCFGVGQRLGLEVRYAHLEDRDLDFVGRFEANGEIHFAPIQIKEFVPEQVVTQADLQAEIDKLSKYVDSPDLVVAFHINRTGTIHLSQLEFSKVPVAELWFFGASTEDQSEWVLIGNLLSANALYSSFSYPAV